MLCFITSWAIVALTLICCVVWCLSVQELLNSKHRLLEAASDRGLLQEALLRRSQQTGDQVTGPYPNTDNQYPVECGPMTKEQIREVGLKGCNGSLSKPAS